MRSHGSAELAMVVWVCLVLISPPGSVRAQEGAAQSGEPALRPSLVPGNSSPAGPEVIGVDHSRYQLEGIASWYGGKFQGRLTANGETFDTNELTAAHREIPFHTIVRVTNMQNGRSVDVRINDRGPFVDNRVIDLSRAAADAIGMTSTGVAPVTLDIIDYRPASTLRTVQIASFGRRGNAEALVDRLVRENLNAEIETASSRAVYRVVLPEVEESDLEDTTRRLRDLGYANVLVRRK
jgi:rare lipoprotein A